MYKIRKMFLYGVTFLLFFLFVLIRLYTYQMQKLVNEGSAIADEQCLYVNPIIIARKYSYLDQMNTMLGTGSAEQVNDKIQTYFELTNDYTHAQLKWLDKQKAFLDRWDFRLLTPVKQQEAAKLQYESREADVFATELLAQMMEAKKDEVKLEELSTQADYWSEKAIQADEEYNRLWDEYGSKPDIRMYFIKVPKSTCPDENFNIPDVHKILVPQKIVYPNS